MNYPLEDYIKKFKQECDGFCHEYTSAAITNTTIEQVVAVAKRFCEYHKAFYPKFESTFGNGKEENNVVTFTAYRCDPVDIAKYFSTHLPDSVVFADTDWDYHEVVIVKNGEQYQNYTARWKDGEEPEEYYSEYDEECEDGVIAYDCEVILQDKKSGYEFYTGGCECTENEFTTYRHMIDKHPHFQPTMQLSPN